MVRDTVPPPPYESYRTEIIFRGDYFHVQSITHREGDKSTRSHELVIFPGANIKITKIESGELPPPPPSPTNRIVIEGVHPENTMRCGRGHIWVKSFLRKKCPYCAKIKDGFSNNIEVQEGDNG